MKNLPMRSPREKVGGIYHFGRMLDKIRLFENGELPEEYHPNLGLSVGLDGFCCGFLSVSFKELKEKVSEGGADEEILEWVYSKYKRPNKIQIKIWNEFSRKFGWNDFVTRALFKVKEEEGLEQNLVVYKKRMLFCIFSCTNSVSQFILSAWLLKLLIVGTVEVKISLNLARRPTINSATAAMIVVNKAAKTPQ